MKGREDGAKRRREDYRKRRRGDETGSRGECEGRRDEKKRGGGRVNNRTRRVGGKIE